MFGSHKKNIKRLLVIRFSAMGDVAMTVPVLYTLAVQNPELRITMLTRTRFTPLYEWLPTNVQVKGIDLQKYDGIMGLTRLYKSLQNLHVDAVADLHDVLRSKYLRTCFSLSGTQIAVVQKGRKEKKALIGHGQEHPALQPMIERYADVFRSLGLTINLSQTFSPNLKCEDFSAIWTLTGKKVEGEKWIGVAPFAAHRQKIYPVDKMQQVVNMLAEHGHKIFLFGAGKKETDMLHTWEEAYEAKSPQAGKVICVRDQVEGLKNEMLLMSKLDLMISMDSANMHIASILGIPVLSIWGATHPKAGFRGYGQQASNEIQRDLPCRPCSIYGKTPCLYGDLRCMDIAPEAIVQHALNIL